MVDAPTFDPVHPRILERGGLQISIRSPHVRRSSVDRRFYIGGVGGAATLQAHAYGALHAFPLTHHLDGSETRPPATVRNPCWRWRPRRLITAGDTPKNHRPARVHAVQTCLLSLTSHLQLRVSRSLQSAFVLRRARFLRKQITKVVTMYQLKVPKSVSNEVSLAFSEQL